MPEDRVPAARRAEQAAPGPAPAEPAARRETPDRLVWPDAAKAVCILLVVLFHATTKHYGYLAWDVPDRLHFFWSVFTTGLRPVRMPLFFLLSGWFAARALRRPLREVFARRVALNYWVYLVWVVITTAVLAPLPAGFPLFRVVDVEGLLLSVVLGWTSLWYLYALPVYFLLARAALRLPLWVAFAVASAAAVAADLPVVPERGDTDGVLANLVFFALGALTPQVVSTLAARSSLPLLCGWSVVYGAAFAVAVKEEADRAVLVSTGLGLLGAGVGVVGFVQLSRVLPALSRRLARLGRHTLPIYVLHMPLLAGLDLLVDLVPAGERSPGLLALAAVYPLLATVLLTGLCLVLHRLLLRCGLGVLFSLPRGMHHRPP